VQECSPLVHARAYAAAAYLPPLASASASAAGVVVSRGGGGAGVGRGGGRGEERGNPGRIVIVGGVSATHRCLKSAEVYMCPHTPVYVSSYFYICVLILLCVSSYYYTCVLILLYVCPHTTLYVSAYYYIGGCLQHMLISRVPTYICILILLYLYLHTNIYVCSYYYMFVFILLYRCAQRLCRPPHYILLSYI